MCEMSKEEYTKKTITSTKKKIDKEIKHFAKQLKLENKMEQYADQPAYVTLKVYKENFKTKLSCRLINPAKSKIEIVSTIKLEKIKRAITNQIKYNHCRNTQAVINLFKSIPNKTKRGL